MMTSRSIFIEWREAMHGIGRCLFNLSALFGFTILFIVITATTLPLSLGLAIWRAATGRRRRSAWKQRRREPREPANQSIFFIGRRPFSAAGAGDLSVEPQNIKDDDMHHTEHHYAVLDNHRVRGVQLSVVESRSPHSGKNAVQFHVTISAQMTEIAIPVKNFRSGQRMMRAMARLIKLHGSRHLEPLPWWRHWFLKFILQLLLGIAVTVPVALLLLK